MEDNPTNSSNLEQPAPQKKSRKTTPLMAGILLLAIFFLVFGIFQMQSKQKDTKKFNSQISSLKSELQSAKSKDSQNKISSNESTPTSAKPVVVFAPGGLFSKAEKDELQIKLVNPMADYEPNTIVAVYIELNQPQKFVNGNSDDKYLVSAIKKDGGETGFLYGSKKSGIDWWTAGPCMNGCTFTNEYKAKYPEVVKKSEGQ